MITNIGSQDIIFRLPWFKDYDPQIDWNTGKITIQKKAKTGWLKYSRDNQAQLEEIKGKEAVTIQQIKEIKEATKKPKGKKKKLPSDLPNWRNKEVPETMKIMEEVSEEELLKIMDTDNIKEHQETLMTTTDIKGTTETSEKELMTNTSEEESTEFTQAPINVFAQIETDNSPLEELWINTKTNILQKLATQETADKKEKTLEEMVPPELLDYKDIFDKVMAE